MKSGILNEHREVNGALNHKRSVKTAGVDL